MTSNCQYERRGDVWYCRRCGYRTTSAAPPARLCAPLMGGERPRSVARGCCRGWAYLRALARWALAGRPTRDPNEIERLHATCARCAEWRDARCAVCGCRITREMTIANKLYLATEHCPLGKW